MPRGRVRYSGNQSRATRLTKTWFRLTVDDVPITTTQGSLGAVQVSEGVQMQTVMRTRGNLLVTAIPDAAADSDVLALGICVVREEAAAAGGTVLPGPIADQGADFWLWHRYIGLGDGVSTSGDASSIGNNVRVDIDSKAMRKVQAGSRIILMGEMLNGEFGSVVVHGGLGMLLGC